MDDPFRRPTMTSAVYYEDPGAALDWLESAFGFERSMTITDDTGKLVHCEMRFEGGLIHVGSVWADYLGTPRMTEGKCTQKIFVHLKEGLDAHCAKAKAAGAEIVSEPEDQFYGDRVYSVRDLGGHVWSFGETVKIVSREEAEAASGLTISGWT